MIRPELKFDSSKWIMSAEYEEMSIHDKENVIVTVTFSDGTIGVYTEEEDLKRVQQKIQAQMSLQAIKPVIE